MEQRGRAKRKRIANNELWFYEDTIALAVSAITKLKILAHITDNPDVIDLALEIWHDLENIRTRNIARKNARKEAVIENNEGENDFSRNENGQPPAA